ALTAASDQRGGFVFCGENGEAQSGRNYQRFLVASASITFMQHDRAPTGVLRPRESSSEGAQGRVRGALGVVAAASITIDVPDGVVGEAGTGDVITGGGVAAGVTCGAFVVCDAGGTGFADAQRCITAAGTEVVAGADDAG